MINKKLYRISDDAIMQLKYYKIQGERFYLFLNSYELFQFGKGSKKDYIDELTKEMEEMFEYDNSFVWWS